jgi:protocatechuate 4,5-dioxygenase, alpha chain
MTIAAMTGEPGKPIPGTHLFDGDAAMKGYALNAMCFSFNRAENREAFRRDEAEYCARFNLTPDQVKAVADRDILGMIAAGGNIYYLAKLAGIFGLNVQDVGAMQTGLSVEAFKQRLLDQA